MGTSIEEIYNEYVLDRNPQASIRQVPRIRDGAEYSNLNIKTRLIKPRHQIEPSASLLERAEWLSSPSKHTYCTRKS